MAPLAGGAQQPQPAQPPPTAQARAPIDLSGYWVSIVTEDWRWRMVTPARGDFASVPLNAEGQKVANAWDLAKDAAEGNQCRAFGVGGLMRMPTRLRISWQDANTLKIDSDAGTQTRLLRFDTPTSATGERTWQGHSIAEWQIVGGGGRGRGAIQGGGLAVTQGGAAQAPQRSGSLKVVTTNMRAGYLRKNGVPYSEAMVLTEYFDRHDEPDGSQWFTVTSIVEDPRYLNGRFVTTSHFRKEPDGSKFKPTGCDVAPPLS
jgi:hypothetical protein